LIGVVVVQVVYELKGLDVEFKGVVVEFKGVAVEFKGVIVEFKGIAVEFRQRLCRRVWVRPPDQK
jgi:hypothetical protein